MRFSLYSIACINSVWLAQGIHIAAHEDLSQYSALAEAASEDIGAAPVATPAAHHAHTLASNTKAPNARGFNHG